ncbi:NmrA/HSCARG family protein [Corallococcus sp. H22C18031201]|nr:NmrA/HSCARG family protein [Corallococcus sp. H22C18031201]
MSKAGEVIVVLGATGQQGGATVRQLLAEGWKVRALVRHPAREAASALARAGVELVPGNMGDRGSLDAALRGAHGVFSVQPSQGQVAAGVTSADEIRFGKNVADAAKATGIRHLVYTSAGGAERGTGASHYESKWEIEQHIARLGLRATVLRPMAFMELFAQPEFGVPEGVLRFLNQPDRGLQLIAVEDIGRFAALAFAQPERFIGEALELAGDRLTGPQMAQAIGSALGRAITYAQVPRELLAGNPDMLKLVDFANDDGGKADIAGLRARHAGLLSFDAWLQRTGKALFERRAGEPRSA